MPVFKRILGYALVSLALIAQLAPFSGAAESNRLVLLARQIGMGKQNQPLEILNLGNEVIVTAVVGSNMPDEALKQRAARMLKVLINDGLEVERVTAIYHEKWGASHFKKVTINVEQLKALGEFEDKTMPDSIPVIEGERLGEASSKISAGAQKEPSGRSRSTKGSGRESASAGSTQADTTEAGSGSPAVAIAAPPAQAARAALNLPAVEPPRPQNDRLSRDYLSIRAKLAPHLTALSQRGAPVQSFYDWLKRDDEMARRQEFNRAIQDLTKLAQAITDYERQISGTPRTQSATAHGGADSGREFAGTEDQYYDRVVNQILTSELGANYDLPDGAFRLERFRISKRLLELERSGQNTETYRQQLRKINELSKDQRRISELKSGIQFLNQQLGLSALH